MQRKSDNKIERLTLAALMTAMITVFTMVIMIPVPITNGYVHLGDTMIFLTVLMLGYKYGALTSALGSALADLFLGFPHWAPWTFCIKGLMALVVGFILIKMQDKGMFGRITAMVGGGIVMIIGYFVASVVMYGNPVAALSSIPPNIAQFVVGGALATAIYAALPKKIVNKFYKK